MKPERIQDALNGMPGWQADVPRRQQLVRDASFCDLRSACTFVAELAEAIGLDEARVAEISVRGQRVRLVVADPESAEVTEADLALVRRLQPLFEAHAPETANVAGG